jgi:hypothetical protein
MERGDGVLSGLMGTVSFGKDLFIFLIIFYLKDIGARGSIVG